MIRDELFNSPLEHGLRCLFLLDAIHPSSVDLQRLVIYDFFFTYSKGINDKLPELQPVFPQHTGQLMLKRELIRKGLEVLCNKGLVDYHMSNDGIEYSSKPFVGKILDSFQSSYAKKASEVAIWIASDIHLIPYQKLEKLIDDTIGVLGTEFTNALIDWEE